MPRLKSIRQSQAKFWALFCLALLFPTGFYLAFQTIDISNCYYEAPDLATTPFLYTNNPKVMTPEAIDKASILTEHPILWFLDRITECRIRAVLIALTIILLMLLVMAFAHTIRPQK
ncbi:MAG: hypothetical protein ACFFDJ_07775 [Candidatus Odinarchaeota archaeon]